MSPRRFSRSRSGQPSKVTKSRLNFAVRHNQNRVTLKSRDVNPLNPLHPTRCEPVSTVARLKSIRCPLAPWSTSRFLFKIFPKLSNASGIFWHRGGHHGQYFLSIALFSMAHPLCPGRTFSDFCCTSWRVSYTALWCLTILYISHDAYTNVYVHILYIFIYILNIYIYIYSQYDDVC